MNQVFVWWVYGGMVAIFGAYALYLARLSKSLREDAEGHRLEGER